MMQADFLRAVGFEVVPAPGDGAEKRRDAMLRIRSNYKPGASEQPASILPVNADVRIPAEVLYEADADQRSLYLYMPWFVCEIERQTGTRFTPRQAQAVWRFTSEAILCELERRTEVGYFAGVTTH